MKAYILAVCGAAVISALIAILLPGGKTGKFINGVLKLFCLLVMLVPLFSLFTEQKVIFSEGSGEMEVDSSYVEAVFAQRAEEEEDRIEAFIQEEFAVQASVRIGWSAVENDYIVEEVRITVQNFGIYPSDEHIFIIEQIAAELSKMYTNAEVSVQ